MPYVAALVLTMLSPALLFLTGLFWRIRPPGEDSKVAYRTALSTRSPETWRFAHRHCAKLWLRLGILLGILTAVLMTVFRAHYQSFWLWLIGGQMLFLCLSIFFLDLLLKNCFDEDGTPTQTLPESKK